MTWNILKFIWCRTPRGDSFGAIFEEDLRNFSGNFKLAIKSFYVVILIDVDESNRSYLFLSKYLNTEGLVDI